MSPSPVFEQVRTTDNNGWTHIQGVSPLQYLSRSELLTRMAKHAFRMWVPLQCLSRSEPLTRMAEHASSMWVPFQHLTTVKNSWTSIQGVSPSLVFRTTDKNGWTHIQVVSPSSVWADQNHWQEWLNMFPASESPVFEQIRTTDKNGWTHIQVVSLSSVWADWNHW